MAVIKKGQVKRGFDQFRQVAQSKQGNLRRLRSCNTCASYYSLTGDEEECHNNNVTSFDMAKQEDGTPYCSYWILSGTEPKEY